MAGSRMLKRILFALVVGLTMGYICGAARSLIFGKPAAALPAAHPAVVAPAKVTSRAARAAKRKHAVKLARAVGKARHAGAKKRQRAMGFDQAHPFRGDVNFNQAQALYQRGLELEHMAALKGAVAHFKKAKLKLIAALRDVKESPVPIPGFGQGAATIPTSNTVLELGTQLDAATRRAVKAAKAKRAAAKAAAVAPAEAPVSADLEEAVAPPSAAAAPKLASQLVGLRDEKAVLAQLCYFERKTLAEGELEKQFPRRSERFLTHELDGGGFNNIRMGLEVAITAAIVTGRKFVVPTKRMWYLINFGPVSRTDMQGFDQQSSSICDFWDCEDLSKMMGGTLDTQGLLKQLTSADPSFAVPEAAMASIDQSGVANGDGYRVEFDRWFRKLPLQKASKNWIMGQMLVPNIAAVTKARAQHTEHPATEWYLKHYGWFLNGQTAASPEEPDEVESKILHLPMAYGGYEQNSNGEGSFRYLRNIGVTTQFASKAMDVTYRRAMRDGLHYKKEVFEIASKVVAFMGLFNYTSLHVRRNDLQYKEVFIGAQALLDNMKVLIPEGSMVYIATDQTDPQFFEVFEKHYKVFQWQDFFVAKGGSVLKSVPINGRLNGLIEQVICAASARFIGTAQSTFTSHIGRLRGHIQAPDTRQYRNTEKYESVPDFEQNFQQITDKYDPLYWETPDTWQLPLLKHS